MLIIEDRYLLFVIFGDFYVVLLFSYIFRLIIINFIENIEITKYLMPLGQ